MWDLIAQLYGDLLGPPVDEDLTDVERVELVTHRCFVRTAKSDDDRWPYSQGYVEPDPLAT